MIPQHGFLIIAGPEGEVNLWLARKREGKPEHWTQSPRHCSLHEDTALSSPLHGAVSSPEGTGFMPIVPQRLTDKRSHFSDPDLTEP